MEFKPPEEEKPVFLSYRHRYNRKIIWMLIAFVVLIHILSYVNLVIRPMLQYDLDFDYMALISAAFGVLLLLAVPFWFEGRFVVSFACTNEGIEALTARRHREIIPWGEVIILRRGVAGLIILSSENRRPLYLVLPLRIINQLISLLREASNSRIEGFGDKDV